VPTAEQRAEIDRAFARAMEAQTAMQANGALHNVISITVGIGDVLTVLDEDGRVLISADISDVTPGNGSEVTITGNLRQPFRFRLAMAFRMVFGIGQVRP
jgi:hypothetical protein